MRDLPGRWEPITRGWSRSVYLRFVECRGNTEPSCRLAAHLEAENAHVGLKSGSGKLGGQADRDLVQVLSQRGLADGARVRPPHPPLQPPGPPIHARHAREGSAVEP